MPDPLHGPVGGLEQLLGAAQPVPVHPPQRRCAGLLAEVPVQGPGAHGRPRGGLGAWEFAFTIAVTFCAYRGLESWTCIGIAWLLHTGLGCAIRDPVIALWCLAGGPSVRAAASSPAR